MIKRRIYEKAKKYMKKKEILAIIGARQVGKTTIMEELFNEEKRNKLFLSFEKQSDLHLFENDIESFITLYIKPYEVIFIDEFQYAKAGGKNLKYIFDVFKKKIVISGSSYPELTLNSLSYLVGRYLIIEVFPFDFEEFLNFKNKNLPILLGKINSNNLNLFKTYFEEFLKFGSFPNTILSENNEEKKENLQLTLNSYILKEIREIIQYKESHEFEKVLEILAISDSTLINKSNISSDTGINVKKITEILSILEKTFMLTILKPYEERKIRELIKSPKTYFLDLGIKNSLLKNFSELHLKQDKGAIYESFILNEFRKRSIIVKFYNYKNSSEVDFLYKKDTGETIAIEIKSSLKRAKLSRGLISYIKKYKPSKVIIFNESLFEEIEFEGVKIIFTHFLNIYSLFEDEILGVKEKFLQKLQSKEATTFISDKEADNLDMQLKEKAKK